jgi:hypothetical protein
MLYELCVFAIGAYVGKYYPQYIPIPKVTQEHTNLALQYLKELQAKLTNIVEERAQPQAEPQAEHVD